MNCSTLPKEGDIFWIHAQGWQKVVACDNKTMMAELRCLINNDTIKRLWTPLVVNNKAKPASEVRGPSLKQIQDILKDKSGAKRQMSVKTLEELLSKPAVESWATVIRSLSGATQFGLTNEKIKILADATKYLCGWLIFEHGHTPKSAMEWVRKNTR